MICPSVLTMLAVWELGIPAYGCLVVTVTLVWVAASISPGELSSHMGSIERAVSLYEPSIGVWGSGSSPDTVLPAWDLLSHLNQVMVQFVV